MSQVTVTLNKKMDKVVGIIKSIYGFSSKDKAIQFIIKEKAADILEKELRPEFVTKILDLEKKGKFKRYESIRQLEEEVKNA